MRSMGAMAKRLLELRTQYRRLERLGADVASARGELATTTLMTTLTNGNGLSPLGASRLLVFKAAASALAWALEVDLNALDVPALIPEIPDATPDGMLGGMGSPMESPREVTLHPVSVEDAHGIERRLWLMEVPAHVDASDPAGCSTEAWSAFLSERQARELRMALARALSTPVPPISPTPAQPDPTPLSAFQPSGPTKGARGR